MTPTHESIGQSGSTRGRGGCFAPLVIILCVVGVAWFAVKPGIHSVPPIGMLPEGMTYIYHSRPDVVAVVSSPDSICLANSETVTPFCRFAALQAASTLYRNKIIELPYLHVMYLLSTGGRQFE